VTAKHAVTAWPSRDASEGGVAMTEVTPEQQALYALVRDLPRSDLPVAAQLEYDRLRPVWGRGEMADWVPSRDLEPPLGQGIDEERRPAVVGPAWIGPGTTHTFHLRPGLHGFTGVLCLAIAAFFLVFPIVGLFVPGFYKDFHAGDVWGILGAGALVLGCVWIGIRQFRNGAQVSGHKLTIRNELRTYTVDASDIRAVTLQPKSVGESGTRWVARVELTSGKGIWIDNFECGPVRERPIPDRAAAVRAVRALLGLEDADLTPETR
jgi:hypothetical protein